MSDTCYRCDEPLKPEPSRLDRLLSLVRGTVTATTYRLRWDVWRPAPWGERVPISATYSQADLCSECWSELLSWVNAPKQQRARIAAANRRNELRAERVARKRREQEIARYMDSDA